MTLNGFSPNSIQYRQFGATASDQAGSTLLVGLIMLVLLTLMAISAMNATTSSIQIVGNAQFRQEATAAAQQAIENVISSNFTAKPVASTFTVAIGSATYQVQVEAPVCTSSVVVTNGELNTALAADRTCLGSGQATNTGIVGSSGTVVAAAASWCYKQKWDIRATVNDVNTGANVAIHQGVYTRVPAGTVCP